MGNNIEKSIGARVVDHRRAEGLTLEELAEKVRVTPGTISRLERGVSLPSVKALEKIAETLNTELKDLFDFQMDRTAKDMALEKIQVALKRLKTEEIELVYEIIALVRQRMKGDGSEK